MKCPDFEKYSDTELEMYSIQAIFNPIFAISCGRKLRKERDKRMEARISTKLHIDAYSGRNIDTKPVLTKGRFDYIKLTLQQKKKEKDRIEKIIKNCNCT